MEKYYISLTKIWCIYLLTTGSRGPRFDPTAYVQERQRCQKETELKKWGCFPSIGHPCFYSFSLVFFTTGFVFLTTISDVQTTSYCTWFLFALFVHKIGFLPSLAKGSSEGTCWHRQLRRNAVVHGPENMFLSWSDGGVLAGAGAHL